MTPGQCEPSACFSGGGATLPLSGIFTMELRVSLDRDTGRHQAEDLLSGCIGSLER
jgi:hypothetical protein